MKEEPVEIKITQLYKKILCRTPDKSGLEFYTKQLTAGTKTLSDVEKSLLDSDEYLDIQLGPKFKSHYSDDEITKIIESVPEQSNGVFTWYHSFRFGNVYAHGTITSLQYQMWVSSLIPENLKNKTVLDIGTADGFYSFLCESRGAKKVVAVDWLEFPGFTAAHKILNSNVEFWKLIVDESNFGFTDLKSKIGTIDKIKEKFDIILLFGVLYHLPNPVMLLKTLANITQKMLLISGHVIDSKEPAMYYYPEGSLTPGDTTNWWIPTPSCLTDIGKRLGFNKSKMIDTFDFDSMNSTLQQTEEVKSGIRRIHKIGLFKMEK
jgi:2-polyprenyl-3-methyl-5-hydroxy-6-metoxy-1,4-benzoquinol methylase